MSHEEYIVRISAGANYSELSTVMVNDESTPVWIDSEHFVGYLVVRMLNFNGVTPELHDSQKKGTHCHHPIHNPDSSYFEGKNRRYSIMLQGRFKKSYGGDDIIFGADFNTSIRTPTGVSLAIKIAKWLDPAIEADFGCKEPYMYSPLVSSMNSLSVQVPQDSDNEISNDDSSATTLETCQSQVGNWRFSNSMVPENPDLLFANPEHRGIITTYEKRKKFFSNIAKRKQVEFSPDYVYCMDFYDAYLDFNTASVKLPGFSLNILGYFDGQQLRYACKTRDRSATFFVVQFELLKKSDYGL
ncbi:hypothetical protein BC833DRAFT_528278 [Globomyces pollinis-pini]|nr:hypothetical protein BC833DRAFT_528278 [Globomyces pollinis-pini]